MTEKEMLEEMARIIAFDLCPNGKAHANLYGNKSKCYSNDNFADCTKIKNVVDKLYKSCVHKWND